MDIYEIRRQNLRELVTERFNGRIAGLAEAIERAPSYLSRCLSGKPEHRKRVGEALARDIEDRLDLPRFWLDVACVTNDHHRREVAQVAEHPEMTDLSIWDDESPIEDDEVVVPYLHEVELAAGSGRFAIEQTEGSTLRFGKRSLRKNGVQFNSARCVTVRGNSMLPVLRDGATVGVDVAKNSFGDIIDGDIYAINHNGQLRIKQVYRTPMGIRLRSFNRDEYPDEDYTFDDVQAQALTLIGHVFWWGMFAR
ncbi:S24 family peptidase [Pseudomonas putida]|uniref:HTH-type transcriptional regulator PrtR n=1 Tax=Pseudomonas putida TaxID=303 RepID=A0A1B2F1A8_PSEPU|nr:S24 family peptidase [Pseudomonas putida]ANY85957.1 HTH-type transcriptional regulator PrtR [Pseudomonas putida]